MSTNFSISERRVLSAIQDDLPDSLTPFADIAEKSGITEKETIFLIKKLKDTGAIRRFGASLRHQKAGWKHNAMVGWIASMEEAEKYAPLAARHASISHIYFRPSVTCDWPYTLYTMIHGRDEDECQKTINYLLSIWPFRDYEILRTERELKKTSPRYF